MNDLIDLCLCCLIFIYKLWMQQNQESKPASVMSGTKTDLVKKNIFYKS